VNSAHNFCCVGGEVSFIAEECHKSDYHGNLPPSLWPLEWGTGTRIGPRRSATILVQPNLEAG